MWVFNRRARDLEAKNRLLIETDKLRALRVEKLELKVLSLTKRGQELEAELAATKPLTNRIHELQTELAAARSLASRIPELEAELAAARGLASQAPELEAKLGTTRSLAGRVQELEGTAGNLVRRVQEREAELAKKVQELTALLQHSQRIQAERDFYAKEAERLAENNRLVTDAATRYSNWGQALNRLLAESGIEEEERRRAWREFVEELGLGYVHYNRAHADE
jgi:myosin heavy subunit